MNIFSYLVLNHTSQTAESRKKTDPYIYTKTSSDPEVVPKEHYVGF